MPKITSIDKDAPFDISTWRHALIDNRRRIERQRIDALDKVNKAIEELSHTYQWDDLYIFGSAIRPERYYEFSDIDIGIEGLDKFMHYKFIADLSSLIEKEVDVIRLEDCSFADTIRTRGIRWKIKK
jgi:predicted nucleotidyltransferase